MLIFNIITCYWIGGWQSDDVFLKMGGIGTLLVHPLIMLIPILLVYQVKRASNPVPALFLFPLLWVGYEYFDNIWQLAFPWLELGNTEAYNLERVQYIEYAGVHGMSFLICSVSAGIYLLSSRIFSQQWRTYSSKTVMTIILVLIGIIFPNEFSYYYLRNIEHTRSYFGSKDTSKLIRTVVIQPNIDPLKKWSNDVNETVNKYIQSLNKSLSLNADLYTLNETSVPYRFLSGNYEYNTNRFLDFVNLNNKYLLMGVPNEVIYPDSNTAPKDARISDISRRRFKTFNSAILVEPGKNKNELQIHEKVKLVPFSENVPYKRQLPFLGKLIRWSVGINDWDAGPGLLVFDMNNPLLIPKTKFSTLICYESVFSDFVSRGVKNGAEFLIIITNDGWFGNSSGPVQHQQYAVLRAIENRKWIVRCAQTGISCFIDPLGNVYDKIPINTEGTISREIIANRELTFYSKHGDIIGEAGFYVSLASIVFFGIFYFYKRRET